MPNPYFKKKRNVAFLAREQIDEELDRLEKKQVSCLRFQRVDCANSLMRKKPNQIRVCADFSTGLNQALKDHHYPLPSPEKILNKLNGGKIFSKIDYRTHIFKSSWKRIQKNFLYRKNSWKWWLYGTVTYPLMDSSKSYINREPSTLIVGMNGQPVVDWIFD